MAQAQMAYQPPEDQAGSELEYHTDLPVGEILRRTRVHYGLSFSDVERALRIRESLIKAIEENDSENLPGRVYAIGFVRSYSEYLGFDGHQVVQLYKQQSQDKPQTPSDLNFPVAANETQMPSKWILGGSLAILLLALSGWGVFATGQNDTAHEIPAVEEVFAPEISAADITENVEDAPLIMRDEVTRAQAQTTLDLPEAVATPSAEQLSSIETASGSPSIPLAPAQEDGILLNVVENSWVEIRDESNAPIVSRVLKSGERYFVPNRPNYTMSIGNAAGLEIFVNGQQIPALGDRGEILKNIKLDVETLKKRAVSVSSVIAAPSTITSSTSN